MSNRGAIGVDRGKNPAGPAGLHVQAIGSGLPIVILHMPISQQVADGRRSA